MKKILAFILCSILLTGCAAESLSPAETIAYDEELTLYLPDDNAEYFETKAVIVPAINEKSILEQLQLADVLNDHVSINSCIQNGQALTIDFNNAFSQQVCSMGTAGEYLIIGSVVNTFLTAYQAEAVVITVDGQAWESGHAIYDAPLFFFE